MYAELIFSLYTSNEVRLILFKYALSIRSISTWLHYSNLYRFHHWFLSVMDTSFGSATQPLWMEIFQATNTLVPPLTSPTDKLWISRNRMEESRFQIDFLNKFNPKQNGSRHYFKHVCKFRIHYSQSYAWCVILLNSL